jgi:hypothetical protein
VGRRYCWWWREERRWRWGNAEHAFSTGDHLSLHKAHDGQGPGGPLFQPAPLSFSKDYTVPFSEPAFEKRGADVYCTAA